MNVDRLENRFEEVKELFVNMEDSFDEFITTESISARTEFIRDSKLLSQKINALRQLSKDQWLKGE